MDNNLLFTLITFCLVGGVAEVLNRPLRSRFVFFVPFIIHTVDIIVVVLVIIIIMIIIITSLSLW